LSFQETGGGGEEEEEGEEEGEEREEVEEVEEAVDVASLDGAVAEATMFLCAGLLCAAREAAAAFRSRAGATDARSDEVPTREAATSIADVLWSALRLKRARERLAALRSGASEERKNSALSFLFRVLNSLIFYFLSPSLSF